MEARYLNLDQAIAYLGNIGRTTARQFFKDINAEVRVGNLCRYDKKRIDEYFENSLEKGKKDEKGEKNNPDCDYVNHFTDGRSLGLGHQ